MAFAKGTSGNPRGRRKGSKNKTTIPKVQEVIDAVQLQGVKSIKRLVTLANEDSTPAPVKLKVNTWFAEMYFDIEDAKNVVKESEGEVKTEEPKAPVFSLKAVDK